MLPVYPYAATQAPSWDVDKKQSSIRFTAGYAKTKLMGRFPEFDAAIWFDPDNLPGSAVTVTVNMAVIGSDDSDVKMNLPKAGWFAAQDYPKAVFVSHQIQHIKDASYVAKGKLTIKNMEANLDVPFTLVEYKQDVEETQLKMHARVDGNAAISRLRYKVGEGEWAKPKPLADEVLVEFTVLANRD